MIITTRDGLTMKQKNGVDANMKRYNAITTLRQFNLEVCFCRNYYTGARTYIEKCATCRVYYQCHIKDAHYHKVKDQH